MAPKRLYTSERLQRAAAASADGARGEFAEELAAGSYDIVCE